MYHSKIDAASCVVHMITSNHSQTEDDTQQTLPEGFIHNREKNGYFITSNEIAVLICL